MLYLFNESLKRKMSHLEKKYAPKKYHSDNVVDVTSDIDSNDGEDNAKSYDERLMEHNYKQLTSRTSDTESDDCSSDDQFEAKKKTSSANEKPKNTRRIEIRPSYSQQLGIRPYAHKVSDRTVGSYYANLMDHKIHKPALTKKQVESYGLNALATYKKHKTELMKMSEKIVQLVKRANEEKEKFDGIESCMKEQIDESEKEYEPKVLEKLDEAYHKLKVGDFVWVIITQTGFSRKSHGGFYLLEKRKIRSMREMIPESTPCGFSQKIEFLLNNSTNSFISESINGKVYDMGDISGHMFFPVKLTGVEKTDKDLVCVAAGIGSQVEFVEN